MKPLSSRLQGELASLILAALRKAGSSGQLDVADHLLSAAETLARTRHDRGMLEAAYRAAADCLREENNAGDR